MIKYKFFYFLFAAFFLLLFVSPTVHAVSHDIANTSNWNIRIDGENANDKLGRYNISYGDLNHDGKDDLIITIYSTTGYNGRNNINITYVIYSTLLAHLSASGNVIDLLNSSNYNLKIVAPAADVFSDYYVALATDLNTNGKQDLVLGYGYSSYGGMTNNGAVYVLYDSILDTYTGTGNIIDLSNASSYNIKFVGESDNNYFGYSYNASTDLNGDGKKDLIISADSATHNGRPNSGSVYVIYNNIFSGLVGTGNIVQMSDSTKYNIRVDGPQANRSTEVFVVGSNTDLNEHGKNDLIVTSPFATNGTHTASGSMYIIYNSLLSQYVGTGNTIDLADNSKYNIRFDGPFDNSAGFGYSITQVVDLNGNNKSDLLIADGYGTDNSGTVFVIYDSIIASYTGTGNGIDLALPSSYNIRYTTPISPAYLGEDVHAYDYNNDGKPDLLIDSVSTPAIYIIYNSLFADLTTTGNIRNITDPANYSILYNNSSGNISAPYTPADFNQDGKIDLFLSDPYTSNNSRTSSGSVYTIYNFPHTISVSTTSGENTYTIKGVINALNSVTNITGVQYNVDSNNPSGTWQSCTADDGSFDSLSEPFTCDMQVANGSHTVYVRAYDTNISYTAQSNYYSKSFTVGSSSNSNAGTSSSSSSPLPPSCGDQKPSSNPDLFQLDRSKDGTRATIYFTPVNPLSYYYVAYSEDSNAEKYGVQFKGSQEGVQSYIINELQPQQTYFIKVRGGNGCLPGDWSKIKKLSPLNNQKLVVSADTTYMNKKKESGLNVTGINRVNKNVTISPSPRIHSTKKQKHCLLFNWFCTYQ